MFSDMFKIRGTIGKKESTIIVTATFLFLFALWWGLSAMQLVDPVFLPSPMSVWDYICTTAANGALWDNTKISIIRIFWGVLISVVIGAPVGLLCGTFPITEAIFRPLCEFIRYMPVPAFVPLVMIWVGIGESAKVLLLFIGVFFQIVLMIANDVRSVQNDLLNAGYTLGATRWQSITKILIPAMLPRAFETLRTMIGWAWTYLVVAEMVAANSGLGYMIIKAQRFLQTDCIFAGILTIGLLGLITDRFMYFLSKRLFSWQEGM